jgi:hypothetical protein
MPAALYALCDAPDSNPVQVTADVVMQTSYQTQDYLLCLECEDVLNKRGENWLLPKLATIDGKFPLYDMLRQGTPVAEQDQRQIYAAARNPKIDVAKISHFAMGVFWKAAAHSWRGGTTEPLIELGKYREEVRAFVRGEGPFPQNMALTVCVLPPPVKAFVFTKPYRGDVVDVHVFVFVVPGIQFVLKVGNLVTREMKRICIESDPLRPILVADLSAEIIGVFKDVSSKAHKSRKLLEYMKSKSAK